MIHGYISIGSSGLVRLDELHDASDGDFINDATAAFVLKTLAGVTLQESTAMSYVADSDGRYDGTITASVSEALVEGVSYFVEITATASGKTLLRRLTCQARYKALE